MTLFREMLRLLFYRGAKSFMPTLAPLLLALFTAPAAQAHAVLESTTPADGAAVAQSPAMITLNFSEAVSSIFACVLDRNGQAVTAPSDASSVDNQLRIRIARPLADGPYMVTYRVMSADTHPVGGAFPFVVGAAGEMPPPGAANVSADSAVKETNDAAWTRLITINRALHLTALLLVAGAALYLLLIEGRAMPSRRALSGLLLPLAALGMLTAVLAVGLQGALMAEAPLNGLFTDGAAAVWAMGAMTTRGVSSLLAVIGLQLLAIGFRKRTVGAVAVLLIMGMLACMASLVAAGHAATVEPRWAALPAWIVHTVMAAFWIGSLAPLLNGVSPFSATRDAFMRDDFAAGVASDARMAQPDALRAFGRFSRIALPGVLALLTAGVVLAVLQCGTAAIAAFDASSRYVLVLAIKVLLVCAVLGLALLNRFMLVPRLALNASDAMARRALHNALTVELLIGVAVIVAAAVLSQQAPPTALRHGGDKAGSAESSPAVFQQSLAGTRGHRARLRITREIDGSMRLAVQIADAKGEVLIPIAVNLELANSAAGIEPLARKLTATTDGSHEFRYNGRDLVVPGQWSVHIDAVITDFEQTTFSTVVDIGAR